MDLLGGATVVSSLGASDVYWQIKIDDSNKNKTVFKFQEVVYQLIHMSLRLCNVSK